MAKTSRLILFLSCSLFAQTARYPSAIATNTDLTDLADRAQTTLSAGLNASATSFTVVSGSKFAANMILTLDNEQIKVCSVVGNTVNVGHSACPNIDGRGFSGTSAASHSSGALVSNFLVSYQFKALREEIKGIEGALGIGMANAVATIVASRYDFGTLSPSGALTSGITNTVTLTPVPLGINGTDTGHLLYIPSCSGGAQTVTITGGTATSGATTGTITFVPTNSCTAGWTLQSAAAGLPEAICALPSVGGTVLATVSATMRAHIGTCGKTSVTVQRQAGATISGAFTILGASPTSANSETYVSQPDYASLATVADGMRVVRGNFPVTAEFGSNTVGTVSAITGAIDFPTTGTGGGAAVAGYARTGSVNANAVGLFGVGAITATTLGSGAWSINGIVTNCPTTSNCTAGYSGINLYSAELDTNLIALAGGGTPVGNVVGLSVTGGSTIQPTGTAAGIEIRQMGIFDGIGWKDGLYLDDGAATVSGISIGASGTGNNVDSMHLLFRSRNSGGTNFQAAIFADSLGDLDLLPATNSWIVLNDGALNPALIVKPSGSAPTVTISNSLIFGSNGSHINTAAANKDIAGKCTFSGTTCTITFTTAYASAPACTAADQTAGAPIRANPSTTQLVLTGGTGAGATDVVSYHCIGNPN